MSSPKIGSRLLQRPILGRMSSFAFIFLFVLILIGVTYSLLVYFQLRDEVEAETVAADRAQVEMGAQFIADRHSRLLAGITALAAHGPLLKALEESDAAALERSLQPFISGSPDLTGAVIFDRKGRIILAIPAERLEFLLSQGAEEWSGPGGPDREKAIRVVPARPGSGEAPGMVLTVPLGGPGQGEGSLLAVYQSLNFWAGYFSRLTARHGREYFIVDQDGGLIVGSKSPGPSLGIADFRLSGGQAGQVQEPVTKMIRGPEKIKSLVSAQTIPELNWTFIISHDYRAAMAPMRAVMRNLVIFFTLLFFCLAGLTFVILAANKVQKRALEESADAARRLEILVRERTVDLSRSTQRYRSLLSELPDVVYEIDWEGRLTFVSSASMQLLGYRPEELLGRPWEGLVHEKDRDKFREQRFRAQEGGVLAIGALRHITSQGKVKWISINSRGLFDDQGHLAGRIGIARDVSNEILGGERIRQLSRQLIQTQEEERKGLALDLHDELGQLLSALKIGLQALPRGDPQPQGQEEELERLITLSQDIMNKVRSLAYSLRPAALDRFGLVLAIEDLAETVMEATKLEINLDLAEIPDSRLSAEVKTTIFRFIQEALTNAVRHSGSPTVEVALAVEGDLLKARVRDFGKGFDAEEILNGIPTPHRLGLVGMKERLGLIGGDLEITSDYRGSILTTTTRLREEQT